MKAYAEIRMGDKKIEQAKAEAEARIKSAEKANAEEVCRLKETIEGDNLLMSSMAEEIEILKAAAGSATSFDDAKLTFKLEQSVEMAGKLAAVIEELQEKVTDMHTSFFRLASLEPERMKNLNYFDRMERAEGSNHKLKSKLDQLLVIKDPELLFSFGLCALPKGAVLQKPPMIIQALPSIALPSYSAVASLSAEVEQLKWRNDRVRAEIFFFYATCF